MSCALYFCVKQAVLTAQLCIGMQRAAGQGWIPRGALDEGAGASGGLSRWLKARRR